MHEKDNGAGFAIYLFAIYLLTIYLLNQNKQKKIPKRGVYDVLNNDCIALSI